MNLVSEEILVKVGEMYIDLSIRFRYGDAVTKITMLEDQKSLVETDYEACLWENDLLHAQLTSKW